MRTAPRTRPYVVVECGELNALYDRDYVLREENAASKELLDYTHENAILVKEGFSLSLPEQQPSWITEALKPKCKLFFLFDDSTSPKSINLIPHTFTRKA